MPASWLKEQLEAARKEIARWPEWKKKELREETEQTHKEPPKTSQPSQKDNQNS